MTIPRRVGLAVVVVSFLIGRIAHVVYAAAELSICSPANCLD